MLKKILKSNKILVVLLIVGVLSFLLSGLDRTNWVYSVKDIGGSEVVSGPDIYLILLDEYPGSNPLCGYDNSRFTQGLEELGFYVPEVSYTNYPRTDMLLSSMLNMDYLDLAGGNSLPKVLDLSLYQDTLVNRILQSIGYTTIHLGSSWTGTMDNPYASVSLVQSKNPYDNWEKVFPFQVESLKLIPEVPGSTFTFMHNLGAHLPYIFPPEGGVLESINPPQRKLDQIAYVSSCVLDAVQEVLEKSEVAPIIIVMSDHGVFHPDYSIYSTEEITCRLNHFFSVYLPEGASSTFPDGPVNYFRYIFNTYFGMNFSYLPSEHYYVTDWDIDPYILVEVTDILEVR